MANPSLAARHLLERLRSPRRRLVMLVRLAASALGVCTFAAGIVILFATGNGTGGLFLVTVGALALLAGLAGSRIELESIELLGARLRVQDVVGHRLQLLESTPPATRDLAATEEVTRRQALALRELAGLHGLYEHVRANERFSRERTRVLDDLGGQMQRAGQAAGFEAAEVSSWFHHGTDALRVIALNVMRADIGCRDLLAVVTAVESPRSNFEQYTALLLARDMVRGLDRTQRVVLGRTIERARRRRRLKRDADLVRVSREVLDCLRREPTHPPHRSHDRHTGGS